LNTQDRIDFEACGLSFEVLFPAAISPSLHKLVDPFPFSGEPEFTLDLTLASPEDAPTIDTSKRCPAAKCAEYLVVDRLEPYSLHLQLAAPLLDIVSAALGAGLVKALSARQGFLLHASGFVHDGLAFVFVGPSGAGKSTVVRNARGSRYMHDDVCAIRKVDDHWRAFGVPMCDNAKSPGANLEGRLSGLFLLRKAKDVRFSRLPAAVVLPALHAQTLQPFEDVGVAGAVSEALLDLVAGLGGTALEFGQNSDLLEWLGAERRLAAPWSPP